MGWGVASRGPFTPQDTHDAQASAQCVPASLGYGCVCGVACEAAGAAEVVR